MIDKIQELLKWNFWNEHKIQDKVGVKILIYVKITMTFQYNNKITICRTT